MKTLSNWCDQCGGGTLILAQAMHCMFVLENVFVSWGNALKRWHEMRIYFHWLVLGIYAAKINIQPNKLVEDAHTLAM